MSLTEIKDKLIQNTDIKNVILLADETLSPDEEGEVLSINLSEKLKYDSKEYNTVKEKIVSTKDKAFLLTKKAYLPVVNHLMWECKNVRGVVCLDSSDPYEVEEKVTKKDILLWDIQARKAEKKDLVFMSGWNNSYTNVPFSKDEIDEYLQNNKMKLEPYLGLNKDIMEIGVGSGMMVFTLHELCNHYDGSDISSVVLDNLRTMADEAGVKNLQLYQSAADQVNEIGKKYDLIIMSSVTEYFSGYNYMHLVVKNCINALREEGQIFIADVFDLGKKEAYKNSVKSYAKEHPGCRHKKDFSHELFFPKAYWYDLQESIDEIERVEVTDKAGTYPNELNLFHYDVMIHIKKRQNRMTKIQLGISENVLQGSLK